MNTKAPFLRTRPAGSLADTLPRAGSPTGRLSSHLPEFQYLGTRTGRVRSETGNMCESNAPKSQQDLDFSELERRVLALQMPNG